MVQCQDLLVFVVNNMVLKLSPIGVFLNLLCSIGMINQLMFNENKSCQNLFKYLLIKSFCDAVFLFRNMLLHFYYSCHDCFLLRTYEMCFYGHGLTVYIGLVAALMSMLCEIAANFNRYRTITNKFNFMDKIPFAFKMCLMCLFVCFYYVYWFFGTKCDLITLTNSSNNATHFTYNLTESKFQKSKLFISLEFTSRLKRDVICVIVLLSINLFTLKFMRQSIKRKRRLSKSITLKYNVTNSSSNKTLNIGNQINTPMRKAEKSQSRITQMVLVTSALTLIGHVLTFFDYILSDICFFSISFCLLIISYSSYFFIYFFFNKNFNKFFRLQVIKFVRLVSFNYFFKTYQANNSSTGKQDTSDQIETNLIRKNKAAANANNI